MEKMMIFDPQKRITPVQALKHAYFAGFEYNEKPNAVQAVQEESNAPPGKNFFNAQNEITNPGSRPRIESRKDVLSRKSNVNKNSFYKNKAITKLPDYLPNKPTVIGSRGGLPDANNRGLANL
jgi:serine/threonine protein kinase